MKEKDVMLVIKQYDCAANLLMEYVNFVKYDGDRRPVWVSKVGVVADFGGGDVYTIGEMKEILMESIDK